MDDQIQYLLSYAFFRIELVNFLFVDYHLVRLTAIVHQVIHFVRFAVAVVDAVAHVFVVVHHKLVIEALVDHIRIYVLAVELMNRLMEHHC